MPRGFAQLLGLVSGSLALILLPAHAAEVLVLRSDASAPYEQTTRALIQGLREARDATVGTEVLDAATWQGFPSPVGHSGVRVLVALGQRACQVAVRHAVSGLPVLCTLVPHVTFQAILQANGRKASPQLSAVYLSQPLARQLALLKLALPKARRVGVIWSAESATMVEQLRSVVGGAGLELVEAQAVSTDTAGRFAALRMVLESSDVLLALPDPEVYNAGTLQNILLACFRAGVPMQAFAANFVQAGALLALYVTPEREGERSARVVRDVLAGKGLPSEPVYVDEFEVGVNQHVARSLGLTLDARALQRRVRQTEGIE